MSRNTDIQWCDSTVNPTMGCDGCELRNATCNSCYAGVLHDRYGGRPGYAPTFEEVALFPGRMEEAAAWRDLRGSTRPDKPWLDGMPRLIFVSDMSDALSKVVTFEYLETEIINQVTSARGQRHEWLWLTKRPKRMAEFSKTLLKWGRSWPRNLWAGTSITTQSRTGRVSDLLEVGDESTIRFLSVEPQWEPIDLRRWLPRLHWVIQGGESGAEAQPFQLEWAYGMLKQCRDAKIPFFLKQVGRRPTDRGEVVKLNDAHGGAWSEWPPRLRVRQFPAIPGTNQPASNTGRIALSTVSAG